MDQDSRPEQSTSPVEKTPAAGRFVGKVAVISGASDKGIGGAIARRLVQEGAAVSLLSRTEPKQLLKRLGKNPAARFLYTSCDICKPEEIARTISATQEKFGGKIDILINNAGTEEVGSLESFTDEDLHRVLEVNLTGTMRLTRAVLPHLPEMTGVIVNVSSALALGGCKSFTAYSASKAGMLGFTVSLAAELAPKRQRVVAVAPALVVTPMLRSYVGELRTDTWDRIEQCHPLGVGLPEDVASAVAFLASDEARWISGVTLPLGWMPSFPLPTDLFLGG